MSMTIHVINLLRRVYFILKKVFNKIHDLISNVKKDPYESQLYEGYVQYFDQEANDYIKKTLLTGKPCVISKFGTSEFAALANYLSIRQKRYSVSDIINYISGKRKFLWWNSTLEQLCSLSGFFPYDEDLFFEFARLYIEDMQEIDILGSYIKNECFFDKELTGAVRINLEGYYAPFYYNNPWTSVLKGKKVLVVHPFEESILNQYARKDKIWKNPDLLPDFDLVTIKAVQTLAGEKCEYTNWFEALDSMKRKISDTEFDIALIGCGAYGLPLAVHVKRMGKQAVHLAGWLQVLFGIIGNRWLGYPGVFSFMNEYWVHPQLSEKPLGYKKIEEGCYW